MYHFLLYHITFNTELTAFLHILLSVIGVIGLIAGAAWIGSWLRPHRPQVEKLTTYESGGEPVGNAWGSVNSRLYMIGCMFILFELETILLFPWAMVWVEKKSQQTTDHLWSLYMAILGTFFILMLGIGLVYALIKSRLAYVAPTPHQVGLAGLVPVSYYEKINAKYATRHPTRDHKIN